MASNKQIKELEVLLNQRLVTIESNITDGIDNILQLNDCECKDELDFAETSSDTFTASIIISQQKQELAEIKEALKSIKNGTYGVCEMCDDAIALRRLKAKPFAKFCTDCREIHENNNK